MRQYNLLCLRHPPFLPPTTNSRHLSPVVPNLSLSIQPNILYQLFVSYITYILLH